MTRSPIIVAAAWVACATIFFGIVGGVISCSLIDHATATAAKAPALVQSATEASQELKAAAHEVRDSIDKMTPELQHLLSSVDWAASATAELAQGLTKSNAAALASWGRWEPMLYSLAAFAAAWIVGKLRHSKTMRQVKNLVAGK